MRTDISFKKSKEANTYSIALLQSTYIDFTEAQWAKKWKNSEINYKDVKKVCTII